MVTHTSLGAYSGAIEPMSLVGLNNFTVPVLMLGVSWNFNGRAPRESWALPGLGTSTSGKPRNGGASSIRPGRKGMLPSLRLLTFASVTAFTPIRRWREKQDDSHDISPLIQKDKASFLPQGRLE